MTTDATKPDDDGNYYREKMARNYREEAAVQRIKQRRLADAGQTGEAEKLGRFIAAFVAVGEMIEGDTWWKDGPI